jgi:transcriptional regulator with XRE-family HTH domain
MPDHAARLKRLMLACDDMSVYVLSEKTGISEGTLGAIIRGKTTRPHERTLALIAPVFGLSVAELRGVPEVEPRAAVNEAAPPSSVTVSVPLTINVPGETYDVLSAVASIDRSTHHRIALTALADWSRTAIEKKGVRDLSDAIRSTRAAQETRAPEP